MMAELRDDATGDHCLRPFALGKAHSRSKETARVSVIKQPSKRQLKRLRG
jgi:hypothetical protein